MTRFLLAVVILCAWTFVMGYGIGRSHARHEYVYITDAEYQRAVEALQDSLAQARRTHTWEQICGGTR